MSWLLSRITGNPVVLVWVIALTFAAGLSSGSAGAWYVQGLRIDAVQAAYDKFVGNTKHAGELAQVKADGQKALDDLKKETSDANHQNALSLLTADNERLRRNRSASSYVPPASAGTSRPDIACFKRADLESALQRFDAGAAGLLDEGDRNTLRLKDSRDWVLSR